MKIQLASDLHLELQHNKEYLKLNPIKPIGDVLILAGDIVPFSIMENIRTSLIMSLQILNKHGGYPEITNITDPT